MGGWWSDKIRYSGLRAEGREKGSREIKINYARMIFLRKVTYGTLQGYQEKRYVRELDDNFWQVREGTD